MGPKSKCKYYINKANSPEFSHWPIFLVPSTYGSKAPEFCGTKTRDAFVTRTWARWTQVKL